MKQLNFLRTWLLLLCLALSTGVTWGEEVTGTIKFGTNDVKINAASVTGDDDLGNTWTITTVGTTSFTSNTAYYQVGSSNKPATSIIQLSQVTNGLIIMSLREKSGG